MTKEAIFPGKPWFDTHGRRIQAHGGAVYYDDGVYYWIGENKQFTHKGSKVWSWGVSAYSSLDLINWRDEGLIIPPVPWDKKSPLHPNRRLDRPHIPCRRIIPRMFSSAIGILTLLVLSHSSPLASD